MSGALLVVKLSGATVGFASTWKAAEKIVADALRVRGDTPPEWDNTNTYDDAEAFRFYLRPGLRQKRRRK